MIRKGKKLAYDIWYVSFLMEAKAVCVIDDNLNKWNNVWRSAVRLDVGRDCFLVVLNTMYKVLWWTSYFL